MERPSCECHGEPQLWQKDSRTPKGGYWVCRAKRREYNRRRHAARVAWMRERYEADPLYRHRRLLTGAARKCAERLSKRKQQTPPNPGLVVFLKAVRPKGG